MAIHSIPCETELAKTTEPEMTLVFPVTNSESAEAVLMVINKLCGPKDKETVNGRWRRKVVTTNFTARLNVEVTYDISPSILVPAGVNPAPADPLEHNRDLLKASCVDDMKKLYEKMKFEVDKNDVPSNVIIGSKDAKDAKDAKDDKKTATPPADNQRDNNRRRGGAQP